MIVPIQNRLNNPWSGIREQLDKRRVSALDDKNEWIEDPVNFVDFVESSEHMSFNPLSDKQYEVVYKLLGSDPKKIFDEDSTRPSIGVCLWGKGSGKDTVSTLITPYLSHVLLCNKSPQKLLDVKDLTSKIDMINVAYSKDQATNIYFSQLKERITHWRWLKGKYSVILSGKTISKLEEEKGKEYLWNEVVAVKGSMIEFPKGIRAISQHSQNESYEGYNILWWVMDEASAFRDSGKRANSSKVFDTLRTSAKSRYPGRWKGLILSWPRDIESRDFTIQKYKQAERGDTELFGSKGATWEVNPTKKREDFAEDIRKYPITSSAMFACEPTTIVGKTFVEQPDLLYQVTHTHAPIVLTDNTILTFPEKLVSGKVNMKSYVGKTIRGVTCTEKERNDVGRTIHVDLGLKSDRASLCMAHLGEVDIFKEEIDSLGAKLLSDRPKERRKVVVIDLILEWIPDRDRELLVSIVNVEEIVLKLCELFRVVKITYDRWNSASTLEKINRLGVETEAHDISRKDYELWLSAVVNGLIRRIDHKETTEQALSLVEVSRTRIDHPEGGHNDCIQTEVGVTRNLMLPGVAEFITASELPPVLRSIASSLVGPKRRSGIYGGTVTKSLSEIEKEIMEDSSREVAQTSSSNYAVGRIIRRRKP